MPGSAQTNCRRVLEETGFASSPNLVQLAGLRGQSIDRAVRYASLIAQEGAPESVYEVGGMPVIYFKSLEAASPEALAKLHKLIWNRGDAPLAMVVTPTQVRLYNCYSRPVDDADDTPHLLDELRLTEGELRKLRRRYQREAFDTGSFWRTADPSINAAQRVDRQLLGDIGATAEALRGEGLSSDTAHALVGRAIFLAYLRDRQMLAVSCLQRACGASELEAVFSSARATRRLFRWMDRTFKADLFPLPRPAAQALQDRHTRLVGLFLQGFDMRAGQGRLWPYDFRTIPTALVSNIYEMFAQEADEKAAHAKGIHCTPPFLANIVLSRAMEGVNSRARVLDPACGSGVFLVEAFRHLAHLRASETGRWPSRRELSKMLTSQIYGLEISQEAARITAFSLYLALLELAEDGPVGRDRQLPRLLNRSVFSPVDAFDQEAPFNKAAPFARRQFDLIISNPPWTSWSEAKQPELGERYCQERDLPIADRQPYQAFLWRAEDFVREGGRIAMLVKAGLLFQRRRDAVRVRRRLLKDLTVETVLNLMDLRHAPLFHAVTAPAVAVFWRPKAPDDEATLTYVCPKWSHAARRTGRFVVDAQDVASLRTSDLVENEWLWKTAFWGTPADKALMDKVRGYPPLGDLVASRRWVSGIGFQQRGEARPGRGLVGCPCLDTKHATRYGLRVEGLPPVTRQAWHRKISRQLFAGAQIIVRRAAVAGRLCAAFTRKPVVFNKQFWGAVVSPADCDVGRYISAVLNSDLVAYLVFMSAASWGVERSELIVDDILSVPIPRWESLTEGCRRRVLDLEREARRAAENSHERCVHDAHRRLERVIFAAYGLTAEERQLVSDGLMASVDFFERRQGAEALKPVNEAWLVAYAEALLSVMNPYLQAIGAEVRAVIHYVPSAPLQVVQFTQARLGTSGSVVVVEEAPGIRDALQALSDELQTQVAKHLATRRNLRVYENGTLYVIKHAERRNWTRSAGRMDGDDIVREHLEALP